MKLDGQSLFSLLITVGAIVIGVAYLAGTWKHTTNDELKRQADTWKSGGEQRAVQITELERRVTDLEKDLKALRRLYDEVTRLNVELQLELEQKDLEIARLKGIRNAL